jgi:hypothetical protein
VLVLGVPHANLPSAALFSDRRCFNYPVLPALAELCILYARGSPCFMLMKHVMKLPRTRGTVARGVDVSESPQAIGQCCQNERKKANTWRRFGRT